MSGDADWAALARELDAWRAAGRRATLWWRDDDAGADSSALARLLTLAEARRVPVALAAVPARLTVAAVARIRRCPAAAILQHGHAHRNHEPAGRKKAEFGPAREEAAALAELRAGRAALASRDAGALPILAPPWNAIAAPLVARLASIGFAGLSTCGARAARCPAPGLVQVNAHVDIVDWRGTRGFVGERAALGLLLSHLRRRRLGPGDPAEPTGLLTHHAVHDAAAWRFIDTCLRTTTAHPAAAWPPIAALFAGDEPPTPPEGERPRGRYGRPAS